MTATAWLNANPAFVLLIVFFAVLAFRQFAPGLWARVKANMTPPAVAPAAPAEPEAVPLVPVYRVAPQGIDRATTEDLTDAADQVRQALENRLAKKEKQEETLRRLLGRPTALPTVPPAATT